MKYAFNASFMKSMINQSASFKSHLTNLPKLSFNQRAMLSHSHVEEFRRAAEIKYSALNAQETQKIIDKEKSEIIQPVPLKQFFTYKLNKNGFLNKYKARLVVRRDLQKMNIQDVYAATLAFKVFCSLMTLVATFGLETR